MPAGFNLKQLLDKPKALARLIETGGSLGRNLSAIGGNLLKLPLSVPIGTGCRFLLSQF